MKQFLIALCIASFGFVIGSSIESREWESKCPAIARTLSATDDSPVEILPVDGEFPCITYDFNPKAHWTFKGKPYSFSELEKLQSEACERECKKDKPKYFGPKMWCAKDVFVGEKP
jgi:hypothetical protein